MKPQEANHIGKQIREWRIVQGLSQQQLAVKLGIAWGTVHKWETGKFLPSPLARIRLKQIGLVLKQS